MLLLELFATIGIAERNLLLDFICVFFSIFPMFFFCVLFFVAITYLKEEYEADPLVVCVIFLGILIVEIIGNTGMRNFTADLQVWKIDRR